MQPLEAGDPRTIGEYRLLRRIGSGGMGRVYLGRSPGGRTVAVKAVHPHFAMDDEFRVRFRREVESARRVGGQWTAPVLDADPDAALPWVATGYVAGPSLYRTVAEHGPMPEQTVRALGAGLAEALGAVHALGLVHRDVKPSNVLLALTGPRLIDFGIARATDGTTGLTDTGASIGSPGYMSPEQALGRGGVAAPSDIFSLGAVLAYAAAGVAPFPGDSSAALLYNVVHEGPDLSALSVGELRDLIAHCLAKRPADRPGLEAVLRALAGDAGAAALTGAGWLPGPVVEQASRSAVALLDMEADAAAEPGHATSPDAGASVSGLVPFTDLPASGETGRSGAEVAWPSSPAPGASPGSAPSGASQQMPAGTPEWGPGSGQPAPSHVPGTSGSHTGRGRFSVSVNATTGPPPGAGGARRSVRQVSCTLVLSVAGVLAAALLTVGIVLDQLPGGGTNHSAGDTAHPPAAHPKPSGEEKQPSDEENPSGGDEGGGTVGGIGDEPDAVPEVFLGTWKGQLTTDDGLPAGVLTVTVTRGEPGDLVGTGTLKVAIVGDVCPGEWSLKSVKEKRLTVIGTSPGGGELCTRGQSDGEFRLLPNGRLRYESHDDASGNPSGTLLRAGGHH